MKSFVDDFTLFLRAQSLDSSRPWGIFLDAGQTQFGKTLTPASDLRLVYPQLGSDGLVVVTFGSQQDDFGSSAKLGRNIRSFAEAQ